MQFIRVRTMLDSCGILMPPFECDTRESCGRLNPKDLEVALFYSRASAWIGSSFEALRAGRKPNAMPITVEQTKARMIEPTE